jgi:hypothetical protein
LSNGQIGVLYSPQTSLNGAKLPQSKGPAKKATVEDMSDMVSAPTILTPHALPQFRDGEIRGPKRKREKDRQDPRKSRRPELPVTGPGRGGRVGASATQHVVQNLVRDTTRDEDVSWRLLFCSVKRDGRWLALSWRLRLCGTQARSVFSCSLLFFVVRSLTYSPHTASGGVAQICRYNEGPAVDGRCVPFSAGQPAAPLFVGVC